MQRLCPHRIYCTSDCRVRENQKRQRERRAVLRDRRDCLCCSINIAHLPAMSKFCSPSCREASSREREREARRSTKLALVPNCIVCGEHPPRTKALTCSEACAAENKNARARRYRQEKPEPRLIARERENAKRVKERAALKLIREIQSKGMEALL
jgi:predicted nucleic acid-binding Zn ribbon protein